MAEMCLSKTTSDSLTLRALTIAFDLAPLLGEDQMYQPSDPPSNVHRSRDARHLFHFTLNGDALMQHPIGGYFHALSRHG